jgi:hypothetical protein
MDVSCATCRGTYTSGGERITRELDPSNELLKKNPLEIAVGNQIEGKL